METGIQTSDGLSVKQWKKEAFQEYVAKLVLKPYMGTASTDLVQVNEELAKSKGDAITFSLVAALAGAGVEGDAVLEGSEEEMETYPQQVTLTQYRNAVKEAGKLSSQRYPFEIMDKAKPALTDWMAQKFEAHAFLQMGSIDGTMYAAASEGAKDSWLANNSDRVLFGAATGNNAANDHSAALLQVDGTTDVLNPAQITLAKRLAKLCDPKIRPIRMVNGEEVFVMFAHPYCTRDLKASDDWKNANRDAMPRGEMNPIFTGALGMYDGVVVVESERIALLSGVGSGSINVAQNFLCGAQALLLAQGGIGSQQFDFVTKEFDYGNQTGVAIASMWQLAKARFATGAAGVSKDHGIVTVYSAAVAD